jgi:hypothetical protein
MKKIIILLSITIFAITSYAQKSKVKIEVLYFKANLACCKARACNALESTIQNIILKNYPDSNKVVFREIRLADEANKTLIDKYKAQSQTVVLVKKKKKKEESIDVSDIVNNYKISANQEILEKELNEKINLLLK